MGNSVKDIAYQLYQDISVGGVPIIIENGIPKLVVVDRLVVKILLYLKGIRKLMRAYSKQLLERF